MLYMVKNHLNDTWFYQLSYCYFRVYPIVTLLYLSFFELIKFELYSTNNK